MRALKERLSTIRADDLLGTPRAEESFSRIDGGTPLTGGTLVEYARQVIRARMEMAKHIPKGIVRDSAWDIMLELFVSAEEGKAVNVKQLTIASGESAASAARLLDRLEEADLIERSPDPLDQRRVIVELSQRGHLAMATMLQRTFSD